jgi:uncharacterized protein YbjT (DUF2867 family)
LSSVLMQTIVSDDVAAVMAEVAVAEPLNGAIELAGPEAIRLDELVRRFLRATHDDRKLDTDARAGYFGTPVNDQSLTPGDNSRIGPTRFDDWLRRAAPTETPNRNETGCAALFPSAPHPILAPELDTRTTSRD